MRRLIVIATHAIMEMGSKSKNNIYGSTAPKNDCKRFTGAKVRKILETGIVKLQFVQYIVRYYE